MAEAQRRRSVPLFRKSVRVLTVVSRASVVCFFRVFKLHARNERDAGGGGFVCHSDWFVP
jgi:hypothetical protein